MIAWQAWGGVWLSIRLGTLKPAPDKWQQLVAETAGEMEVSPRPRVFVANTATLNAFAYQAGHAIFLTRPLLDHLSEQQVRALTAHELGHLQEGRSSHFLRVAQPLIYAPILCLNPLLSKFDFGISLLICLGGFILASRLYARFLQRAEFQADATGHEDLDATHLAEALVILYRENLIPAVLHRGGFKSHPDLYDRIVALGVTPDFDHPAKPQPPLMALLAIACIFVIGIILLGMEVAIQLFREQGLF